MLRSGRFLGAASLVLAVPLLAVTTPSVSGSSMSEAPRVPAAARATWGSEEVVAETGGPNEEFPTAVVRVRTSGSAVAAWIADAEEAGTGPLMVARRQSDGHWTAPLQLVGGYTEFDVAVGRSGLASVVWEQLVGDHWRVKESHLRSGTWTAAQTIGTGSGPRVTIDGRGITTVVWSHRGIRTARLIRDGTWRSGRVTSSGRPGVVRVNSNSDGDLVVAWHHDALVSASVRPHGGRWSAPRTWSPDRRDRPHLTGLQATIGPDGQALVMWSATDVWREAQHDYANYVAWSRSTPSGTWPPSRILTRSLGEDGGELTLSMNDSGAALAAWIQIQRTGDPSRAWAARFRANGTWGAPLRVTPSEVGRPAAFMDRRGKAHVVADGGPILAFHQSPGRPWSVGKTIAKGDLLDASGRGMHLIAIYGRAGDRLRAVGRD